MLSISLSKTPLAMACLLAMAIGCTSPDSSTSIQADAIAEEAATPAVNAAAVAPTEETADLIQLAILLDTSNSMDGLIDQAKSQLWQIVNKVTSAKRPDGSLPNVRVALYQYGNDGLPMRENYIQKISDFTGELDQISAELFALTTNGGSEYCGAVVGHSLDHLEWTNVENSLKMVFIAGNEAFSQGPIPFKESCRTAKERDIIVNTIFCGPEDEGLQTNWGNAALLAEGKFFSIDSDAQTVFIETPYDDRIIELNDSFNETYMWYGELGQGSLQLQRETDGLAEGTDKGYYADRIISKNSNAYFNSSWDLVDAYSADSTVVFKELGQLPDSLSDKSEEEIKEIVKQQKADRDAVKQEIAELKIKREEFIAQTKAAMAGGADQLGDAILNAIENQAVEAGYNFEK
ncbi:VWA domain-containing protein [Sanyastnella coralliicola]|uniref:VWA domain-containing protein n=1 Tax=Sanyastnella coralliicola TaxID=3069118 RepID=UPI0027BB0E39|nr:VWA domain-containing protein [Longitalea sp. SCSIO 12813]